MRRSTSWGVGMVLAGWMAIAGVRSAAGQDVGFNKLTKVQPGMTMLQVLQTVGPPSDIRGHTFIYSVTLTPNTSGKVVFASKGSPLDQTKVVKVETSPVQERFK